MICSISSPPQSPWWWHLIGVQPTRVARTAGSDGLTVGRIDSEVKVPVFLGGLRTPLKSGQCQLQPVQDTQIPKLSRAGKMLLLGIPTVADHVVLQVTLKLVLESIFETDFEPVSCGFRPAHHTHDAIAEIHLLTTQKYRWVLDHRY